MSFRGGGGGKRERKKDVWDVEGGYMGVKKQKLEEQFTEQVFATKSNSHVRGHLFSFRPTWRIKRVASSKELQYL